MQKGDGFVTSQHTFPYRFHTYEPALFVELYLPKRALYQGTLYESLTDGFDIKKVVDHLQTHIKQIHELFSNELSTAYDHTRLSLMKPIIWGYSMYEVDGVFLNEHTQKIGEERSQVIRIMFRFSSQHMMVECGIDEHTYLGMRELIQEMLETNKEKRRKSKDRYSNKEERSVIEYIDQWIDDVAFLLFGYIIFNICLNIQKKVEEQRLEHYEEEIWVTSLGKLQINRIKHLGTPSRA